MLQVEPGKDWIAAQRSDPVLDKIMRAKSKGRRPNFKGNCPKCVNKYFKKRILEVYYNENM